MAQAELPFATLVSRRIIFGLIALSVIVPLLRPVGFRIRVSPPTRRLYDEIEKLPPGSVVLLSFDYDPAAMPEVQPMALALLRHCFERKLKVVTMALWAQGASISEGALQTVAVEEYGCQYGVDYVNLGFKPGAYVVIQQMGTSIAEVFPVDIAGRSIHDFTLITKHARKLSDIDMIVSFSAGDPGILNWVMIAQARFQRRVGGGCTAVAAPAFFPYLNTGQLVGLLGGMTAAAEYEQLVEHPDTGTAGMDAQSFAHGFILLFIVIGNVIYVMERRRARSRQ
jgi:hypothetical protein